jgi:hypothetical protein
MKLVLKITLMALLAIGTSVKALGPVSYDYSKILTPKTALYAAGLGVAAYSFWLLYGKACEFYRLVQEERARLERNKDIKRTAYGVAYNLAGKPGIEFLDGAYGTAYLVRDTVTEEIRRRAVARWVAKNVPAWL